MYIRIEKNYSRERVFAGRMEPFSFERLALKQNGEKSRREARGTDGIARRQERERERESI